MNWLTLRKTYVCKESAPNDSTVQAPTSARQIRRILSHSFLLLSGLSIGCKEALTACDTTTLDPVVAIRGITNAVSGAAIDSVFISEIQVDGFREHLPFLIEVNNSFGASVAGDSLICRGTCGFGFVEGTWQMVLRRERFQDLAVTFEAHYQHNNIGQCPGRLWGPTDLRFEMTPLSES